MLLWAALEVGKFAGPVVGLGVAALIFDPEITVRNFIMWMAGLALALCAIVVAVMYIYVALSGGVMSSEERGRYLQKRREARRGRW